MKKKVYGILIIIVIILIFGTGESDGFEKMDLNIYEIVTGAQAFLENPVGYCFSSVFDLVIKFADAIQMLANLSQTVSLGTYSDWKITYSYSELANDQGVTETKNDESSGHRNMYTNVGSSQGEIPDWQKEVIIPDNADEENSDGFTDATEIPVIPVDIYNMSIGNINFFDINFLEPNEEEQSSAWMILRNFIVTVMSVTLYVGAAVMLTMLIWHGVCIVKGSITPQARAEHKEGLTRFATSLLMLVGSIIIIAIGIFASDMFIGDLKSNTYELPIRVNVESAGYSFSTNITGVVRYMAQIQNVNLWGKKAVYAFSYLIFAILNFLAGIGMFIRMIVMGGLCMGGPIVATMHAINKEDNGTRYRNWVKLYLSLAVVQVILAIASRIILEVAIQKNIIL